ncbi:UNVERIFIED_CONTAM: hypothetical protein FKN15_013144 [Acipenser sinensis]
MAVTRRGLPIESITGAEALVESCGDGEPQKKKRATEQSISSSRGETLGSPDLAQYVNEVKRDNETLREIYQFQLSIENLNQSLRNYGRPKVDGEVRVASLDKRAKQDRHIFLFDKAVIVCKRRGDNYEMKEVIDLHNFKITNNPTTDKENKKWSYGFYLTHIQGQNGFEFFFKTKELKKKWLEQFGMAIGIFYQGYLCSKCGAGAHKECLGRLETCGKTHTVFTPKVIGIAIARYDFSPRDMRELSLLEGDMVKIYTKTGANGWWRGEANGKVGWFPSTYVEEEEE